MPQNIDFNTVKFVDKKYVHKNKESNCHIYNLRRAVPRIISCNVFENHVLSKLSDEDKDFLLSHYTKRSVEKTGKLAYVLKNLPINISVKDMEDFFQDSINDDQKKFLLKFYKLYGDEDQYKLSTTFSGLEELQLAKILRIHFLLITDFDRAYIAEILESFDEVEKVDIFYANMHVDPNHEYFFEHKLDHVAGMMLMETARQFFMACAHIYGNVPLDGVFFTLDSMKVNFSEYLWLSYPVRLELRMSETTYTDQGFWHRCSCNVIFIQEFRKKAGVEVSGMTFPMNALEKIVTKKHMKGALDLHRLPGVSSEVFLKDIKNNITFVGSIMDISPKHIMVEFLEDVDLSMSEEFEFRLSLEKHFHTYGVCILRTTERNFSRSVASFLITHIDSANTESMNEIIKRLCHIRERRGIM